MFITAKLVFESYMTDTITKGMWFKQRIKDVIYGRIYEYDRIYEVNHTPQDVDSFLHINGLFSTSMHIEQLKALLTSPQ